MIGRIGYEVSNIIDITLWPCNHLIAEFSKIPIRRNQMWFASAEVIFRLCGSRQLGNTIQNISANKHKELKGTFLRNILIAETIRFRLLLTDATVTLLIIMCGVDCNSRSGSIVPAIINFFQYQYQYQYILFILFLHSKQSAIIYTLIIYNQPIVEYNIYSRAV